MTQDQISVFHFIARYVKAEGIAPSIWEVSNGTGISYNKARFAMMDLERLGYIKRRFNRPRAIAILKWPDEAKTAA
jgi:SOS-response transcriptional repressor LexA